MLKQLKYKFQNFSTYFITWFFPKGKGKLFWKVYVYFRWVDDVVDDPKIKKSVKKKFLKEQNEFLKSVYAGKVKNNLCYEEKCMFEAIPKENKEFKKRIFDLMWTFDFDVDRFGGKRVKYKELMKYSRKIGETYVYVFQFFLGKNIHTSLLKMGHVAHLIHMFRDYSQDQSNGYNNLPTEFKDESSFIKYQFKKKYKFSKTREFTLNVINRHDNNFLIRIACGFFFLKFEYYLTRLYQHKKINKVGLFLHIVGYRDKGDLFS